jgi:phage tail sheath gpL-like
MAEFNIPGVYSAIDASAAVQALSANDAVIGIVAQANSGVDNTAYAPINYGDAVSEYGADSEIAKLMKFSVDNGGNKFIIVKVADGKEVASLTITTPVTTSSNVTITLNSIAVTVAVLNADSAIAVATKIRDTVFAGWTTGGTEGTAIVTFIADVAGVKTDAVYSAGTTGSTGIMTTTIQGAATADYQAALDVLELEEAVSIVITDSTSTTVHGLVKAHCRAASINRKERIAYYGMAVGTSISTAVTNAAAINSELMYSAHPNPIDINGNEVSGIYLAAAMAGIDSAEQDPSMPMTNLEVKGFYGSSKKLKDSEMDTLILAGIVPIEVRNGVSRIVRLVSTYTKNAADVDDITWQERTTVKITHYILKDLRADLTSKFSRAKQNQKSRDSVKSAVISRLKGYETLEYIENVLSSDVSIAINAITPTRNDVTFKYDVVTPMNVIHLTGHLVI